MRTVVVLDTGLSMAMGDLLEPAKAMAGRVLEQLRWDSVLAGLVIFGEQAVEADPKDVTALTWFPNYGTNLQAAITTGVSVLGGPGRLVLISKLEPTSHTIEGTGQAFFGFPPDGRSVAAAVAAVRSAAAEEVVIEAVQMGRGSNPESLRSVSEAVVASGGKIRFVEWGQHQSATDELLRSLRVDRDEP